MPSSMNMQEIAKRRRERRQKDENKEQNVTEVVVVEQESWTESIKYYYNRFRYYHFYVADKIETCIGVVSLSIIKLYFFLMGYGPVINNAKPLDEDE
ncbi:hypothetical protein KPH14_005928 [Odynerus spinipes]|uniref:Uncharacterized protein n=1 Tax=Odynerus spinipes TaxID=1348599 RepID=A0AAD9RKJ0_9HYME|nr:hypothetical protein KPH14_005928 [Odynerus spinipes]